MRLNLDIEGLHVETTVMQPDLSESQDMVGVASILWNTLTEPIERPNTDSSPCIA